MSLQNNNSKILYFNLHKFTNYVISEEHTAKAIYKILYINSLYMYFADSDPSVFQSTQTIFSPRLQNF